MKIAFFKEIHLIFEFPLEYSSFNVNIRVSTWHSEYSAIRKASFHIKSMLGAAPASPRTLGAIQTASFNIKKASFNINIRVSTWIFEFPFEYSSFHLNIRVSTWIFEFPLEHSSFHLNIRVSTWIFEIPLDIRLDLQGSTFHENRLC